jgi:hypothetical protein
MKQLTYAEIKILQYILNTHISSLDVKYDDLLSLKNKLITMRAELEYPHSDIDLSLEEINNSL